MSATHRLTWVALAACLAAPALTVGCGDDESATPRCPDLPLFDVRELEGDASAETLAKFEEWKKAAAANEPCVTGPGKATIPEAGAGG